LVEPIGIEPTT